MILNLIKNWWGFINKINPETRSLIIILLFGWIMYSQIISETNRQISENGRYTELCNKKAEQYSMKTSIEINHQVQLIAEKDKKAFDVLLLNYHNNTQSLQGYKYLYLSCLTEAPRSIDVPLLKQQWNRLDYVYYADELAQIHKESIVHIDNHEDMIYQFPKLYRLIKASDAKAVSFFTIEGHDSQIGLIVILYKEPRKHTDNYGKIILSCVQKLAILLDYNNYQK